MTPKLLRWCLPSLGAPDSRRLPRAPPGSLTPRVWDWARGSTRLLAPGGSEAGDARGPLWKSSPSAIWVLLATPPRRRAPSLPGNLVSGDAAGLDKQWDQEPGTCCSQAKAEVPVPRDRKGLPQTAPSHRPSGTAPSTLGPSRQFQVPFLQSGGVYCKWGGWLVSLVSPAQQAVGRTGCAGTMATTGGLRAKVSRPCDPLCRYGRSSLT